MSGESPYSEGFGRSRGGRGVGKGESDGRAAEVGRSGRGVIKASESCGKGARDQQRGCGNGSRGEVMEGKQKKEKGRVKESEGEQVEEEGLELVSGANQCQMCLWDNTCCQINSEAITCWRERFESGKRTVRALVGTSCE
jgi:hypothetical protein